MLLDDSTWLYPTHVVWPMGFAWSSAVAQDTTVATALRAGILGENILCPDHDPPACQEELCIIATDDTVLFHRSREVGAATLASLDAAFEHNGIPTNKAKDVTLASEVTALSCDLFNDPARAEPAATRLGKALCRALDLLTHPSASPRGVHALLGVWQWFGLLQRGFFSIYDSVYDFVRLEPEFGVKPLPSNVINEFLTTLLLSPLLVASLDRFPLPLLVATDASPDFGFGVAAKRCSPTEAAEVCRLAERRGDYVRLTANSEEVEVPRLGKPTLLKCAQADFTTVISSKAKGKAHSGVLETHGFLLGLKWVVRSAKHHHCKIPFLVDAKAVVGAVAKGRSSARAFRTLLRAIAAYTLAADVLLRLVYIPSESNPADAPSRGKKRWPVNRPPRVSHFKPRRSWAKSKSRLLELRKQY